MPRVKGFLRIIRRGRPGRPDISLPDEGEDQTPDWGIEEGELPEVDPPTLPKPPWGVWPPLTPENPWRPIDPGWGIRPPLPERPERPPTPPAGGVGGRPPERPQPGVPHDPDAEIGQLPVFPPGLIWPPLPPGVHGKYLALVLIGGMGHGVKYRYVVIDADAKPPGGRPDNELPETPPTAQPKR